jgi:signal transduction histidine kinase
MAAERPEAAGSLGLARYRGPVVVRAAADESAFDQATAPFMRSMLGTGGRLFADMASDVRPRETLRYLCDSARDLLAVDAVRLRLRDTSGFRGVFESASGVAGNDTVVLQLIADIGSTLDAPLGQLEFWWAGAHRQPTSLDELVATRFASMALLVLERHHVKRRQLHAIALEREAVAGEIHDDPIQVMTAVSLQLQRAAARLPEGEDRSAIQQARSLNDSAIERLRHAMFSLHPTTLVEDGLAGSIEAYCESFVETEGLRWEVTDSCAEEIPLELAALAFRLCRNALVNVIEHAEASVVAIDLTSADHAQGRHARVGHLEIPHAAALARWAAGTHAPLSAPGRGATVTVALPIL